MKRLLISLFFVATGFVRAFTLPLLSERALSVGRGRGRRWAVSRKFDEKINYSVLLIERGGSSEERKEKKKLPEKPSLMLIGTLWLNTAIMGMLGLLACCYAGPEVILGDMFEISWKAGMLGILWAMPWLLLSAAPLEKWFPQRLAFLREVGDHTEIFTAMAFGSRFGGIWRWIQVIFGSLLLSISAGIFEEMVFRGTAQRFVEYILQLIFSGMLPINDTKNYIISACAVIGASSAFGYLHNYTAGYALLATLAGIFFGTVYAVTQNLFVAAITHALVDAFAFITCYFALARADTKRLDFLASRNFPITNALRMARENYEMKAKKNFSSKKKSSFSRLSSILMRRMKDSSQKNQQAQFFRFTTFPPPSTKTSDEIYSTFAEANNFSPPQQQNNKTKITGDPFFQEQEPAPYHEDISLGKPPPPPPGYPGPPPYTRPPTLNEE